MKRKPKMYDIEYISGGRELLDRLCHLWEKLTQYHQSVSTYFSSDFSNLTFTERKKSLSRKAGKEDLRIDIASVKETGVDVGYCISTVDSKNQGEIDSLFVESDFRKYGIGRDLMVLALGWLEGFELDDRIIVVAHGNELVYDFYSEFGFYPRTTVLRQRS